MSNLGDLVDMIEQSKFNELLDTFKYEERSRVVIDRLITIKGVVYSLNDIVNDLYAVYDEEDVYFPQGEPIPEMLMYIGVLKSLGHPAGFRPKKGPNFDAFFNFTQTLLRAENGVG